VIWHIMRGMLRASFSLEMLQSPAHAYALKLHTPFR